MEEINKRLEAFLRTHLDRPDLHVTAFDSTPGGHSGFTYFVTTADSSGTREFVLRLPPPGVRIAGPADVLRQGRIMAALALAGQPVPPIAAVVEDGSVLDGRPFILMERLPGLRVEDVRIRASKSSLASAAISALRGLHELPLQQTGIGSERPVPLSAEIDRWTWLMDRAPQELTASGPRLRQALASTAPADPAPRLVHADFHYGNLLFEEPVHGRTRVTAILDWEIAEIGAPLLDLGSLYIVSQRYVEMDIAELLSLYAVSYDQAAWYFALGMYKYAAIFGYNLMLHRRGKRPDPMYEGMTTEISDLLDQGLKLLN
ncbi:MAG: phosphotransferase family protein [Chloroflexota bacterium]|nr:phosphotransferase family protein [Chloroflexota bacterium]